MPSLSKVKKNNAVIINKIIMPPLCILYNAVNIHYIIIAGGRRDRLRAFFGVLAARWPPGPSARSGQLRRDQLRPPSADRRRLLRVRPGALPAARFLPGRRRCLLPIRFFGARPFRPSEFFRAGRFSSFFDFPRALSVPQNFSGGFSVPFDFSGAEISFSAFSCLPFSRPHHFRGVTKMLCCKNFATKLAIHYKLAYLMVT